MTTLYGRDALSVLLVSTPDWEHMKDGDQEKHNHVDCPAGEDTKQRLYVKHVDGAILFHCHHCGTSGYYRPRERYSPITVSGKEAIGAHIVKDGNKAWHALLMKEEDYDNFRIEGQLWLGQYGFGKQLCSEYSIREVEHGIVLPIYGRDVLGPNIEGYQIRRYNGSPKYYTYTGVPYSYLAQHERDNKPLVITEDLLSSYKLHAAGFSTLCLLGTNLSEKTAVHIGNTYPRQVLWLDDDKGGHHGALSIVKEFSVLLPELTAIFHKQPKEIDMDDLKRMEL